MNNDYLPTGSRPSRGKQQPGWRPAAQTRASPPHQAKSGLDGDPGVWAYVCIFKLQITRLQISQLLNVPTQSEPGHPRLIPQVSLAAARAMNQKSIPVARTRPCNAARRIFPSETAARYPPRCTSPEAP